MQIINNNRMRNVLLLVSFELFNIIKSEEMLNWNITKIQERECSNCFPFGIRQFKNSSENITFLVSFPRWKSEITSTLTKYIKKENINTAVFEPWPNLEENDDGEDPNTLHSVTGFEIYKDNIFILDQGKIENDTLLENSTKMSVYNLSTGKIIKRYIFLNNLIDKKSTFFNDIVIDKKNNKAFISDSGLPINTNIHSPKIFIVDLNNLDSTESINIYLKMNGSGINVINHSSLFADNTYWMNINEEKINDTSPLKIGVSGLALSCDSNYLFYSPLSSRMIFSIKINDDLFNNKDPEFILYNMYKHTASDGIVIDNNLRLYLTSIEQSSINYLDLGKHNLNETDYRKISILNGSNSTWPGKIFINDRSIFALYNEYNKYIKGYNPNFKIIKVDIKNMNYLEKCKNKKGGTGQVILWALFLILVIVVLSFVLMSSHKQEQSVDKHMDLGLNQEAEEY